MIGPHSGIPHSTEQEPGSEEAKDMQPSERPNAASLEVLGWVGQGGGENTALACHARIMAAPGDELRKTLNYYA